MPNVYLVEGLKSSDDSKITKDMVNFINRVRVTCYVNTAVIVFGGELEFFFSSRTCIGIKLDGEVVKGRLLFIMNSGMVLFYSRWKIRG